MLSTINTLDDPQTLDMGGLTAPESGNLQLKSRLDIKITENIAEFSIEFRQILPYIPQ